MPWANRIAGRLLHVATTESHQRVRLDIAYDGTNFHGWATQPQLRSVQGVLEDALRAVFRTNVALTVAGRTDAGVHASAQVAHFDVPRSIWQALPGRAEVTSPVALVRKLTGYLARGSGAKRNSDVVVRAASEVPDSFDARFSALARHYEYRIADLDAPFDPLRRHTTWWVARHLDASAMQRAGAALVGEWDFAALCKPRRGQVASTIRRVRDLRVQRSADHCLIIHIGADAFCHSMVRSIVGCLVAVGSGAREVQWLEEVLHSRDRSRAAAVAPAHGLCLVGVDYPSAEHFAEQAARARRVRTEFQGRN